MSEKNRKAPGFNEEIIGYQQVKDVMANYSITPFSLRREGDAWVMETDQGSVRVERFRHSLPEFFFVLSAVSYLREKGFSSLPGLFNNKKGQPITEHPDGFFLVMENPPGRPVDLTQIDALTGVTRHLAELHRASVGFTPPPVLDGIRQDWGDWEEKWQYRLDELYRLGEEAQHHKGDFEHLFLKVLDDFIQDGVRALEKLKALNIRAIVEEEKLRGGLCQRDYKPGNLRENEDGYRLIDFDDFAGQSHLEDVARFIKEVGDWDPEKIQYIFNVYSEVYHISEPEKEAILAYLKLPLDLWKVARNHYLRDKPQKQNLKKVVQEMNRRKRCFSYLENPKRTAMAVNPATWTWDLPAVQPQGSSIDEYWNRWNWGNVWQVAGEKPAETEPESHGYDYVPDGYYAQNATNVDGPFGEDFAAQGLATMDPPVPSAETETFETMAQPESSTEAQEPDLPSAMETLAPTTVETVAETMEMPADPEESQQETLEQEEDEEQPAIAVEQETDIVAHAPVASAPKITVWKSFPKPLGK
jgi:CotS family spore coat protein